jgi:hypothetical protein
VVADLAGHSTRVADRHLLRESHLEMASTEGSRIAPSLRSAMLLALAQQAIVLALASATLDGGVAAQMCLFGFAAFWVGVAVIFLRRGTSPTRRDLMVVRSGSLPAVALAVLVTWGVWHWRGVW